MNSEDTWESVVIRIINNRAILKIFNKLEMDQVKTFL